MNNAISTFLKDCRFYSFRNSLLKTIESSISDGIIYFNCYQNILNVLILSMKTFNYDIKLGSMPMAYIYGV